MPGKVRYALRAARPDEREMGFLFSRWIRNFGDARSPYEKQAGYADVHRHVITMAMEQPGAVVVVACGVGDEVNGHVRGEDFIYGYAVGERRGAFAVLHWVYVRDGYRRRGIANAMVREVRKECGKHVTVTAITAQWMRDKALERSWRIAEMAPLYSLVKAMSEGKYHVHQGRSL